MRISDQLGHYPVMLSAEISYTPCPALLGNNTPCASNPSPVNITSSLVFVCNGTSSYPLYSDSAFVLTTNDLYVPIANIVQIIHAAVLIDLGNPHKNNFLLNPSMLDKTLYSEFPAILKLRNPTVSMLYQTVFATGPLKVEGPAKLEARYLCHLQQMRAPAQAFIAVLVATLSMFVSGWGFFTLLATYWAKRSNDSGKIHSSRMSIPSMLITIIYMFPNSS